MSNEREAGDNIAWKIEELIKERDELAAQVEVIRGKSDVLLRKINENIPIVEIEMAESELREALSITPSAALREHNSRMLREIRHFAWSHGDSATCRMLDEKFGTNPMAAIRNGE